jgi:hypothetical protein
MCIGQYHLQCLEKVMERVQQAHLRVNIEKSSFATRSFEYDVSLVTTDDIHSLEDFEASAWLIITTICGSADNTYYHL